ncbi:redoxin family protein [Longitalea arenae]|uniref:redoxin family protein n=1 Tax=Longitalea arenae TaxID=2812558 RepID=UPI0019686BFB|nr:redoxin family protein [Longitalea arenae]
MKSILLSFCFLFLFTSESSAQPATADSNGPHINQLCPDFTFDTLINYKNEKLALTDLRGKFVIVDFWGTFCAPCIAAIPKIEALQKKFGNKLQVLMVATDGFLKAKQFYETRSKANKAMVLPCAINRKFVKYFQIKEVSTYVWLDDQGYIKAITDESQITEQNLSDFIAKKSLQVRNKEKEVLIDRGKPLLAAALEMDSGNVMYSSTLTKHLKGVTTSYLHPSRSGWTKVNAKNLPVILLYQIAFGDSVNAVPYNRTVIESAHPEKFTVPKDVYWEEWKLNNTYCYELTVPADKQKDILKIMRDELKNYFGYNAFQDYRSQKCLVLRAEKDFHFWADKSAPRKLVYNTGGITVINYPFARFAGMIQHYMQDKIIFDETGLTGNVDIVLQAEMNDVNSVNEALKKYGLQLHWEERQVQVLVIKDQE